MLLIVFCFWFIAVFFSVQVICGNGICYINSVLPQIFFFLSSSISSALDACGRGVFDTLCCKFYLRLGEFDEFINILQSVRV